MRAKWERTHGPGVRMEGRFMADELSTRDAKLIQYLNEAYGKEKELETALQAHIKMAKRPPYKKRLQEHLKETKAQSKGLERRIKALGGKAERAPVPGPAAAADAATAVTSGATKAMAVTKGPIHALRGTGESEKQLKNAKDELWNEYQEIGNYTAIEVLAESLNDDETVKLAREYRRQEERMANFLLKLIPQLAKAVVVEEVPAAERRKPAVTRTRTRATRAAASPRSSGTARSSAAAVVGAGAAARRARVGLVAGAVQPPAGLGGRAGCSEAARTVGAAERGAGRREPFGVAAHIALVAGAAGGLIVSEAKGPA